MAKWTLTKWAMVVAVLGVLVAASRARALDEWTAADYALQVALTAVTAMDWLQTHNAVGRGFKETNPVLGLRPSTAAINRYFAATLVGHVLVARLLPRPWRSVWQLTWIGVESGVVGRNFSFGVRLGGGPSFAPVPPEDG